MKSLVIIDIKSDSIFKKRGGKKIKKNTTEKGAYLQTVGSNCNFFDLYTFKITTWLVNLSWQ